MTSLILAAAIALNPGMNRATVPVGRVVAAEAATTNAAATVAVKAVRSVTAYTNAYRSATARHLVYAFAVTNWDGEASVATNILDRFSFNDWTTPHSPTNGVTNTVSRILGNVSTFYTNLTESVFDRRIPAETFFVTNDLISVTTSGHYGATTNGTAWHFGGDILVTGATADDLVTIIVE